MSNVYDVNRSSGNGVYDDVFLVNGLAVLEAADTVVVAGEVYVQGTIAATDGDTAAIVGDNIITAYFGEEVPNEGSIDPVIAADTAAIAGDAIVTGVLSIQILADTSALVGVVLPRGGFALVPAADSCDIEVIPYAVAPITENRDTCEIVGRGVANWVPVEPNAGAIWVKHGRSSATWHRR